MTQSGWAYGRTGLSKTEEKKKERKSGVSPETTQAQSMYYLHVNDSEPLDYQDLQTDKW